MTTLTGAFLAASPGAVFAEGQVSSSGIESTLLKQAAEEKPLDSIASALGEQGRGRFADIYTNVRIEVANGRVILYTTNLSRAADLIATAKRDHPDIETDRVSLEKAQYSKKELDARIQDIMTASKVAIQLSGALVGEV